MNPLHAGRLAQLFERAEYSAMGTDSEQAAKPDALARSLRQSMWRQASWWMRLRRLFSPTALVASPVGRGSAAARDPERALKVSVVGRSEPRAGYDRASTSSCCELRLDLAERSYELLAVVEVVRDLAVDAARDIVDCQEERHLTLA